MNLLAEIDALYRGLPQVACMQCGSCCVSPTCTLAEFLFLMHHCADSLPPADMERFVFAAPRINESCEGNLVCQFLKDKLCGVHLWRTGACRLFGIPSLKDLGITDLESCEHDIRVVSGDGSEAFVRGWLEKLSQLNRNLYDFGAAPYHVYGLNLECWLDVYFDDHIEGDVFRSIRETMQRYFDLSAFKDKYVVKTGIKEKIDKISILSMVLEGGDKSLIRGLVTSIKDDYPLTGTYYLEQAETLLKALEN